MRRASNARIAFGLYNDYTGSKGEVSSGTQWPDSFAASSSAS